MEKKTKFILFGVFVFVVVLSIAFFANNGKDTKDQKTLETFASCISNSGAKFYGTFWCSHCQNQKKMFGLASKNLPYVECSNKEASEQLQVCAEAGIEAYPTWVFADGSRQTGELSFEKLAEKTSCNLNK